MSLQGYGYAGRCRFKFKWNSTNCQCSKVETRKMTEEEMKKYGVNPKKENKNKENKE